MENQTKTTLTLNPEEEKQSNTLLEGVPVRKTVQPIVQTQAEYSAGSIDESMLSNDEKEMIAQFANEIDISNAKQVIQYGSSAQKSISDFSVNILGKVKTSELGDVGDALKELTVALDATTEPEKKGILGIFQKAKRGVDSIKANYAKAETNVSSILPSNILTSRFSPLVPIRFVNSESPKFLYSVKSSFPLYSSS